jgi:MFS family permease
LEESFVHNWREHTKIFYGWWLVAALFVILFNTGSSFYIFPVFIDPLQDEFGWSITQISGCAALWALVFGFSSPLIGVLISRFGALKTMLVCAVMASLPLLGLASMQNLWMLYAMMAASAFVVAGTTLIPVQTLVTNWFNKYRGRAMSLTMVGLGFGGWLLPILNEFLIRQWGWRFTWVFSCIILWVIVVPLIAIFVRTKPSDLGLLPDGEQPCEEVGEKTTATMSGLPVKRALASQTFWVIFFMYVLRLIGLSALTFHFIPFAIQQVQFTSQQAAFFFGLAVGFSIAGRLLFGWLADRYKPTLLTALAGALLACGPAVVWLLIIRGGLRDVNLLWLYAVPYGIGIGANAVMLPILVGRCFGELYFSKILGLVISGFAIGIIVSIPVAAKIFDTTGSYEIPFIGCLLAFMVSAIFAVMIRPERYQAEFVIGETERKLSAFASG